MQVKDVPIASVEPRTQPSSSSSAATREPQERAPSATIKPQKSKPTQKAKAKEEAPMEIPKPQTTPRHVTNSAQIKFNHEHII